MKTVTEWPADTRIGKPRLDSKWGPLLEAVRRGEIVKLDEADLDGKEPDMVRGSIQTTARNNHGILLETRVALGCLYVRMKKPQ